MRTKSAMSFLFLLPAAGAAQGTPGAQPPSWTAARLAQKANPQDARAQSRLVAAFQRLDRQGLFNTGAAAAAALKTLGRPDQVREQGAVRRFFYGFLVLNVEGGRVASIVDVRRISKAHTKPSDVLRFALDGRKWRLAHAVRTYRSATFEHVLPGETPQRWTELTTSQRFYGCGRRPPRELMDAMRKDVLEADPRAEWSVLSESKSDLVYEWRAGSAAGRQHRVGRLVRGARDMHHLAYVAKVDTIEPERRALWLGILKAARVRTRAEIAAARKSAAEPPRGKAHRRAKRLAWEIGSKWSLAAILACRGADPKLVDRQIGTARTLARFLKIELPALPRMSGDSRKDTAAVLTFLLRGGGRDVVGELEKRSGRRAKLLYEMALKSNLTLLLYAPGDSTGKTIADRAEEASKQVGLPEELWRPAVETIRRGETYESVKSAILEMHKGVSAFLAKA